MDINCADLSIRPYKARPESAGPARQFALKTARGRHQKLACRSLCPSGQPEFLQSQALEISGCPIFAATFLVATTAIEYIVSLTTKL